MALKEEFADKTRAATEEQREGEGMVQSD